MFLNEWELERVQNLAAACSHSQMLSDNITSLQLETCSCRPQWNIVIYSLKLVSRSVRSAAKMWIWIWSGMKDPRSENEWVWSLGRWSVITPVICLTWPSISPQYVRTDLYVYRCIYVSGTSTVLYFWSLMILYREFQMHMSYNFTLFKGFIDLLVRLFIHSFIFLIFMCILYHFHLPI